MYINLYVTTFTDIYINPQFLIVESKKMVLRMLYRF